MRLADKTSLHLIQSLLHMYKVISKWPHQDSIRVEWNMGKRCNLDCGYCPAEIHDNFSPHLTLDEFKHCLKLLHPHLPTEPHRRLYITGGEPTINPMLPEFVKHAISFPGIF